MFFMHIFIVSLLQNSFPFIYCRALSGQVDASDESAVEVEGGGEINWSSFAILLPFLAFVIGVLTSLMGIGGGELIGPLLLTLQVRVHRGKV